MKGLILSSLAGLIIASIGCSYASDIRFSAVNESAGRANLIITSETGNEQVIALGSANATLTTAKYEYPAPISIQTRGQFKKPCKWTDPPNIKQVIRSIDLTISPDPDERKNTICLLDWH